MKARADSWAVDKVRIIVAGTSPRLIERPSHSEPLRRGVSGAAGLASSSATRGGRAGAR